MVRLLSALAVCSCLLAQTPKRPQPKQPKKAAEAARAWPVEKIEIEGLRVYSPAQVIQVLGLQVGRPAAGRDFEAARERLVATGAFESVGFRYAPGPNGEGYVVTYEVTEAGPRFPVRFEGLGVPDPDVKAALRANDPFFADTIPATEPLLARYTKEIEKLVAARGGKEEKILGKLEPDENGALAVLFRPASARPVMARVTFSGNSVVPSSALENAINSVAIGMPYTEARFRQLLDTQVRPLYDARGRVRAAFPEVRLQPEKDVNGVVVSVRVDEGVSYSLKGVQVEGTGLAPAELKKVADFKPGDMFNREVIEAGVGKIERRMRRDGYMHVQSHVERQIDDQSKSVAVTVRVEPGPRYTFGTLNIQGLDILTEPAIRKLWTLKEGQPFNAEYPDYFLAQVREEGILDNLGETRAVTAPNDANRTVDVTLYFKGEPPKPKEKKW